MSYRDLWNWSLSRRYPEPQASAVSRIPRWALRFARLPRDLCRTAVHFQLPNIANNNYYRKLRQSLLHFAHFLESVSQQILRCRRQKPEAQNEESRDREINDREIDVTNVRSEHVRQENSEIPRKLMERAQFSADVVVGYLGGIQKHHSLNPAARKAR